MIDIIIPTCPGSEKALERCVNSIIRNTTRTKEFTVHIVKNNFIGFAKAVNKVMNEVKNDIIILNDDTTVFEGWIESFELASKEYDVIGNPETHQHPLLIASDHVQFWGIFIKKEVVKECGTLDERFEIGEWEDVDFCWRALDKGFKIGRLEEKKVMHWGYSHTMKRLTPEQVERKSKNKEKFLDKWKGHERLRVLEERNKLWEKLQGETKCG